MYVIVTPYSKRDPYLRIIHENLQKKYDIRVLGIRKLIHPISFLKALKYRKQSRILHIHWIEAMYRAKRLKLAYPIFAALYLLILKILGKVLRYRIVITLHNVFPHEIYYPSIEYKIFRENLKIADHILVHSNSAYKIANIAYGIEKTKISVIKHAGWTRFYPTSKKNILKEYNVPKNCFVFGNIGKIRRYKGVQLLLEAFKLLREGLTEGDLKLIIAGDPSEDPEYLEELLTLIKKEELLRKNVILIPKYIDDSIVSSLVLTINVGVFPYISVTTPSAALLFLSYGKPLIVSRLKATEEYCSEGSLFFNSGNVSDLADKMLALLKNNNLYKKLSREARSYMQKSSWDNTVNKLWKIYKRFS